MNYLLVITFLLYSGLASAKNSKKLVNNIIPGEFIVKLRSGADFKSLKSINDLTIKKKINDSMVVIKSSSNKSVTNTLNSLESNPYIEYAEPNLMWRIVTPIEEGNAYTLNNLDDDVMNIPNDPYFNTQWGLKNSGNNEPDSTSEGIVGADIKAIAAWRLNRGDKRIKVAVIDTGVDYNHEDLKDQMWINYAEKNGAKGIDDDGNGYVDDIYGWDSFNNDGDPMDGHGHGTHCAGVIGASHDNGIGISGIMPDVTIMAIKFLSDAGSGSTDQAIAAIDYAIKQKVDIMSNSWGGGKFSDALKETIQKASNKGIIFVAASGNDSNNTDDTPQFPSGYDVANVVSVGALTAQNTMASFSNYGASSVDVAAPGKKINSTVTGNKYKVYSGTSMATPHVAGALGLLLAKTGRLSHQDMMDRLIKTSDEVVGLRGKVKAYGGSLNAHNLLLDNRPYKDIPKESDWETIPVDSFETSHPYEHGADIEKSFHVPGAKFIRLKVKKMDLEKNYDYIKVMANGITYGKLSGKGENKKSVYVDGENLNIKFHSDSSVNYWGFVIDEIQAVR